MTAQSSGAAGAPTDADLIRERLEALGLSQRDAARQLGIDERSMRYYAAGKMPVPPVVFLALRQLEQIRANDHVLAMLADGTMRTSDGELTAERLREGNEKLRLAIGRLLIPLRKMVVHDALQQAYDAADQTLEPLGLIELEGKLRQVFTGLGRELESPEKRGNFAVLGGLHFIDRRSHADPVWGMHWQPLSTWVDHEGGHHHQPDVASVDDETILEWSRRARDSRHPVLRARYADLAWEFAKFRVTEARRNAAAPAPIRPDVENARVAIDAYLDAVERQLAHDEFDAWRYLGRALELSLSIRDTTRVHRVKAGLFNYRSICETASPAYPFWLFDDIAWEQRNALGLNREEKMAAIEALERALALRADQESPERFDPHLAQSAADRLGRWRQETGENTEARLAADIAGRAFEAAAEKASGLTAIAWLSDQAARYRSAGDATSAARVEQSIRQRATEAKGEFRRVETRFEFPKDEFDKWVDQAAGASFDDGLHKIVRSNLVGKKWSETGVRDLATKAVLQARINLKIMRDDGFARAEIGSIDEDLDGRAVRYAADSFGYSAPFLQASLLRFCEKHSVDLERLTGWLASSPLFPESRLALVREGLAAWFAKDPVKTTHVLLPQIEAALRDLLAALGGAIYKRDKDYGGFQVIALGQVLNHEIMRAHLPEDVLFHLKVLLQDPRGINLRPEFAHGLGSHELFDLATADWVVHALMLTGLARVHRGSDETQRPDGSSLPG